MPSSDLSAGSLPEQPLQFHDLSEAPENFLETPRRLSESLIWDAQRRFFENQGIDAWRQASVPYYVTNNPALAKDYATLVFGFLRDRWSAGDTDNKQPFYIVELGAGCARFGFLFVKALRELRAQAELPELRFQYVLTDLAEQNLEFWRAHPTLRPFLDEGTLDFALFDVERDREITLINSRTLLRPGSLEHPLIVIANYLFDSLPHDAFFVQGGELLECLVTASSSVEELDPTRADVFSDLALRYERRPADPNYYPEPAYNRILSQYARALEGSSFLFPIAALRGLDRIESLSGGRFLLISGDRGHVQQEVLCDPRDPEIAVHGSFSFAVNYHAIGEWFRDQGGAVLKTTHRQVGLHTVACLLGCPLVEHRETRLAYSQAFCGSGADDFFCLRRGVEDHYGSLDLDQVLSLLRMSRHDPRILRDCLPALGELADKLTDAGRAELGLAIQRVWENYFHIGEAHDLAFSVGLLLSILHQQEAALALFRESLRLYGPHPRTLWNMAMCLFDLGRREEAAGCLSEAWLLDPTFRPRLALLPKE